MSAKFIAQIEMSKLCVNSDSSPADATRPRIVSSSGSPAATSEPKASTMIAIVTGQERNSDFIIAALFAVLKSLQTPDEPVSETVTAGVPAAFSFDLSESAAATIAVGPPFAPAVTTAVWPSGETPAPGRGRCTEATRLSPARPRSTRRIARWNSGAEVVIDEEWTTTVSAELESPAKFRWISVRACTDSEPSACQPAPDSAVSTFGAKAARATATIAHTVRTARTWSAAKRPSLPTGPTRRCSPAAAPGRAGIAIVAIFSPPRSRSSHPWPLSAGRDRTQSDGTCWR